MRAEDQTSLSQFNTQIMMRRLFLAALGGVALAGDTIGGSISRCAVRGEYVQWEAEETTREILGQFRLQSQAVNSQKSFNAGMQWLVKLMGLPSQQDVQILHEQLDRLYARIDALIDHHQG